MTQKINSVLFFILVAIITLFIIPSKVLAQTIFTDSFNGTVATQWSSSSYNSPVNGWIIQSGVYGYPNPPIVTDSYPTNWDFSKKDISYEVDLKEVQGVDKNIIIKYVDDNNFVGVHTNNEGTYLTGYVNGDKITTFRYDNQLTLSNNVWHHYKINVIGNKITVYVDDQLIFDNKEDTIMFSMWKIGLRAGGGTQVWFDNVKVTEISSQIPVTKVVFIPGFGASWNGSAFADCQPDSNPEHWTLASYAESIYNPILTALSESGWQVTQFNYDWRQQVPSNATVLSDKINSITASGEKVDIAGHSMGGLVARAYLEMANDGKIDSLITAGSPHQGAAQSYPAWAGGNIWNDNFLAKIAMTLYLKHCGGIFSNDRETIQNQVPSVQNLLPTNPYLQKVKTNTLYLPASSINKNNWLPTIFSYPPNGVRMETISGYGFKTLQTIETKVPSKKDLASGDWLDGKSAGKLYSTDGDGTVLAGSAQISGVTNVPLNQTHSGLINSIDGMTEILRFLGTPSLTLASATPVEINSALVVIGYPSSFWVTDQNGDAKKDTDGMVAFVNPKSGNYKLSLIPKSNNTSLIVAQFLQNGDVKYKEYNFKGLGPKFKTVKFDLQNPIEDPLN